MSASDSKRSELVPAKLSPYVIKSKEAIHIANEMTLLQRQSWNHLLYHAYDHLLVRDEHAISVAELTRRLGIQTRNVDHLKEALEGLGQNILKWDVLDADGESDWGFYSLLSRVRISRGIVTYAFDTDLRSKLHNPKIYARISLAIQNRFRSKHALALYEVCVHWRRRESGSGETPWISIAKFRELMGLADGVYPEFKKLNKWVIKDPLAEINELTDLHVDVAYKRHGHRIVALKLRIWTRAELTQKKEMQGELFSEAESLPEIVSDLMEAGLPESEAFDIWGQGWDYVNATKRKHREDFIAYVREKIALLSSKPKDKVKNRIGFLIEAIREDYTDPNLLVESTTQRRQSVMDEIRRISKRKDQIRQEWDDATHRVCKRILDKDPQVFDETLKALLEEEPFTRTYIKRNTSAREVYESGGALTAMIDSYLKRLRPRSFKATDDLYKKQIDEIEQEIGALGQT